MPPGQAVHGQGPAAPGAAAHRGTPGAHHGARPDGERTMSAPARGIYMDHHATSKVDPRVLEAMLPYLTDEFGNASSRTHAYGWRAEEAVTRARSQVAKLLNADPKE